jgi:UDP-N-acetylmuramate dehydrogenase
LGEMKEAVKAIRLVTIRGEVVELNAADIEFGYRHARLPRGVVVGVWLQLKVGRREQIEKR